MELSETHQTVIAQVIKAHGPVLDLEAEPALLIEIFRKWGFDLADDPDGGSLPGGVAPPDPCVVKAGPGPDELMKAILTLQRQVEKLSSQLSG